MSPKGLSSLLGLKNTKSTWDLLSAVPQMLSKVKCCFWKVLTGVTGS